jgi:uncharacterized membrane protein (UPF0127 family)
MDLRRAGNVAFVVVLVGLVGLLAVQSGFLPVPGLERHETACFLAGTGGDDHDRATVTLRDGGPNGTTLGVVDARVADSSREMCVGLSDTPSVSSGEGMLFVHDSPGEYTYVMRGMEYGLDIVFIATNGRITGIQHARPPNPGEDGETLEHTGTGTLVLEVPRGYTNETGVDVGDRVRVEYRD